MEIFLFRWLNIQNIGFSFFKNVLLLVLQGTMLGTVLGMSVSGLLCDIKLDNGWPFIFYIFGEIKIEVFSYLTTYYMLLPSATKLRRLCFYTCLSVILFTGRGLPQCMLGYHTPRPAPLTRHPPGADTPRPGTPLGADTPYQAPPPPTADSYCCDGTHPTGMHSCLILKSRRIRDEERKVSFLTFR